jgi:hypothetical protein
MTPDDIILRMAQAILDVHRQLDQTYLVSWDYLAPKQRAMYRAMAHAAVEATRQVASEQ